jgi:REP element-mobilizing transposase RayT
MNVCRLPPAGDGTRGFRLPSSHATPTTAQVAGGIYHITSRGNRRQPTFVDSIDHRAHLACVSRAAERYEWRIDGFCHMPNHIHLMLRTRQGNLSAGMQWLNGSYAQRFNGRHGLTGHLFQGRFHSVLVETDEYLLELNRYIVLNPVRAGLCDHPLAWRWSSCRATLGLASVPDFLDVGWLLEQLASNPEDARRRYLDFIEDRLPRPDGLGHVSGSDP